MRLRTITVILSRRSLGWVQDTCMYTKYSKWTPLFLLLWLSFMPTPRGQETGEESFLFSPTSEPSS